LKEIQKIQKKKCKVSSFRHDILHGRGDFTFFGQRRRVTIKRLQLPEIQQNWILMIMEITELAIFHTMEWIQAAKTEQLTSFSSLIISSSFASRAFCSSTT
jgi:hypothetical protein